MGMRDVPGHWKILLGEALDIILGRSGPSPRDVDLALAEAGMAPTSAPSIPVGIKTVTALGEYAGEMASMVATAKYSGLEGILHHLGRRLGLELIATATWLELAEGRPFVVPAPMPAWRRAHRGIDHARVIAHGVASQVDGEVRTWLSTGWRSPQVGSDRGTRREVIDSISPSWAWRVERDLLGRKRPEEGRPVVLVDDVITTGSTMAGCARVLDGLGFGEIHTGVLLQGGEFGDFS